MKGQSDGEPGPGGVAHTALSALDELLADQRARWAAGEATPVEAYLERKPAVLDEAELLLDLIYNEVVLREAAGESPRLEEYQGRFPRLAAALADHFEVHRAIGSGSSTTIEPRAAAEAPVAPGGAAVAGCTILGLLGRGGMGVVYRARQPELNRLVALKMLLAGAHASPDRLVRFRAEAEAAARLQHPNIVQVFGVGEHEGLPCLVMEYVEGGTLAERLAGGAMPPREAARLVEVLARAMGEAHRRGVVHRDLKPANVLLTGDGAPKITDFGLAKLLIADAEGPTRTGDILGTPSYMAPEQAGAGVPVGPTADIYALGAILYEALVGRPPFLAETYQETLRRVVQEDPPAPSRLGAELPCDLETICLKCLEKEPARRYASAPDLADELRRFLDGEPILARPVGATGRLARWARREPILAGLTGAVAALLILSTGVAGLAAFQYRRSALRERDLARAADHQRGLAVRALERATRSEATTRAINDLLLKDILDQGDLDKNALDKRITLEELLERAAREVDSRFAGRPELEAAVRTTIGDAFRALGRYDRAEEHLRRAVEIRLSLLGPEDPDTLATLHARATLLMARGEADQAAAIYRQVVDVRRRMLGPDHRDTIGALNDLALALRGRGDPAEVERLFRRALEQARRVLGRDDHITLVLLNNLGDFLHVRQRLEEAEAVLREALEANRRVRGPEAPDTLATLNNLAATLRDRGDPARAEPLLREAIALNRRVRGPEHPGTLTALTNLAATLQDQGRLAEAEPLLREAAELSRRTKGPEHPETLVTLNNLAVILVTRGDRVGAEPLLARVVEVRRKKEPEHPNTLAAMANLAAVRKALGRPAEAEPMLREALATARRVLPAGHPLLASLLTSLGAVLVETGRPAEAEPLLREAVAIWRRTPPAGHWRTAAAESILGGSLSAQGRFALAERLLVDSYPTLVTAAGVPPMQVRQALDRIIALYTAWGRPEAAATWQARQMDLDFPVDPIAR